MPELASGPKTCYKCRQEKPAVEFTKNKTSPDGLSIYCRECSREYSRAWRAAHPGKAWEYVREWRKANPERRREIERKYRSQFTPSERKQREKMRNAVRSTAWRRLREAIEEGRIHKPSRCEDCGVVFPVEQIHGHHEDYTKPLNVIWVCRGCHQARHDAMKADSPSPVPQECP